MAQKPKLPSDPTMDDLTPHQHLGNDFFEQEHDVPILEEAPPPYEAKITHDDEDEDDLGEFVTGVEIPVLALIRRIPRQVFTYFTGKPPRLVYI